MAREVLYKGTIRGLVTGESRINVSGGHGNFGVYLVMKLEERIGLGKFLTKFWFALSILVTSE